MNTSKKGFTLLELVIVIGILAVLGVVAVLVLNPAQLFAQARDTTRIEDLGVLRNALSLYTSTVTSPDLDGATDNCTTLCYIQNSAITGAGCAGPAGAGGGARHGAKTATADADRTVAGAGWVPVDFTGIPGGSPVTTLPIDPSNDATYFYSYACNNTAKTFELGANMESTRYANGGTDDKEINTKDGGNNDNVYEVGNEPGLDI